MRNFDINTQYFFDNMRVNKLANGGGWYYVDICYSFFLGLVIRGCVSRYWFHRKGSKYSDQR